MAAISFFGNVLELNEIADETLRGHPTTGQDNGSIASITPDVPADSYPNVFYPPEPIRYVLEMKAGEAAKLGWTAGTLVRLPLPYGQ